MPNAAHLRWNIGWKEDRNDQGVEALEAIADSLQRGGRVLLHCDTGRCRSPMAAAFWLVWHSINSKRYT